MSKFVSQLSEDQAKTEAKIPENMFKYIKRFTKVTLAEGEAMKMATPRDEELGIMVLQGSCELKVGGKEYKSIGKRQSRSGFAASCGSGDENSFKHDLPRLGLAGPREGRIS